MSRIFGIATFISIPLCVLCALVAFSCYRLFVEGTVNDQNQIIHEQWLLTSGKRYGIAACAFAIIALVRLFQRGRAHVHSQNRRSTDHRGRSPI